MMSVAVQLPRAARIFPWSRRRFLVVLLSKGMMWLEVVVTM